MNKHKILYVENELIILLEIRKELENEGYEVTTATSGEKALKILEEEGFDLVITDVIMGEVDGFIVVNKAKELCPETTTMILTGYEETDFAIKALRLGVDDYMLKPYETEDLLFRVKRCLEKGELLRKNKKAEDALRESEEKYRTLVENATEAIVVAQDGVIKFANPKGEELYGYSQEELASMLLTSFIHEEDREIVWERHGKRLRGEVLPSTYPFRIIHKTGDTKWVELNVVLFSWEDKPATLCFLADITERKQAEEELRESEKRFRDITENALEWIWEVDTNGKYVYSSSAVENIFGYNPKEMLGKHFYDLFHPEEREQLKKAAFEVFDKKQPFREFINRNVHKNGKVVWLSTSGVPILDKKGNLLGYRGADTNITERKQAEEALRESEERYRSIFEQAADSIVIVDSNGALVEFNDGAHENLGYTRQEFEKLKLVDFEIIDSKEEIRKHIEKVEKTGSDEFETKHLTKNGDERWVLVNSKPISIGGEVYIQNIWRDVTERKRAEEALRVSEERFTLVAQGSSDGIWDWDIQNNSLYWSPRLKELLGYADDELEVDFDTFDSLLHPDDRSRVKTAIEAHLKDRVPYDVEERLRTKSGDYRWFHIRGHSIWDEAGNPIRMAGSNIDITERKKAEEQIKASLREKEVLLQEIHHRVRNNMQVVSSLLKLQAGKMKDEKVRQAFKESQSRVSAMALVHETLYRSKSMAEIELQKHIPALIDSVYRTYRVKGKVKFNVDIEDIKLSIGQATPLSLVINELISNSLQHAFPEGKGEVSVKLHLRGEDKIEVVISDNGWGMPEDIDYDKTLGLQLVKGLVESQLEGTWKIKTEAGTKHTIRFKKKEYFGPSRRLDARSAPH